jgi:uncharacterized repeat protein (TIGR01451 family)
MKKIVLSIVASLLLGSQAYALGTDAGTDIANSATLTYSAGGNQESINSNTDSFKVDKKIDMVLVTDDTKQTEAAPGEQDKITTYSFKNEGNSNQKFKFEVANLPNGKKADYNDKQDSDDVNNLEIQCTYTDGAGNSQTAGWDSSFVIEIKEDTKASCKVRADIKTAADGGEDGDVMNVELKATAYKDDESGPLEETSGADTQDSVDVVFADGESVANGANSGLGDSSKSNDDDEAGDGMDIARSGYIISVNNTSINLNKTSCPISDPVNNTTNPKRIPGAIIRYMFDIENNGTTDVSSATLKDTLDSSLDLSRTDNSAKKDENKDSCSCTSEPTNSISGDTTVNGQEVTIENINISNGKHTCVSFEVEIK